MHTRGVRSPRASALLYTIHSSPSTVLAHVRLVRLRLRLRLRLRQCANRGRRWECSAAAFTCRAGPPRDRDSPDLRSDAWFAGLRGGRARGREGMGHGSLVRQRERSRDGSAVAAAAPSSGLLSLECSGSEGLNPISRGAWIGSGRGRCSPSVRSTASDAHSPILRAMLLLLSAPMVAVDGAKPPGLPLCLVN
jgi:hypothetical protein